MNPNGDASTLFAKPTYPSGLLLKRIRVRARDWATGAPGSETNPDGPRRDALAAQRRIGLDSAGSTASISSDAVAAGLTAGGGGNGPSANQLRAIRRQMQAQPQRPLQEGRPNLVPVAVPSNPAYLHMAADAITEFNSKGKHWALGFSYGSVPLVKLAERD